jgi:hypothetical protein
LRAQIEKEEQRIASLQNSICISDQIRQRDFVNLKQLLFSIKSDVFSFGVLLIEIISGKRTAGFYQYGKFFNLTGYLSNIFLI